MNDVVHGSDLTEKEKRLLFWASFLALAAAGAGFAYRIAKQGDYGSEFGLTYQQVGQIMGASFWPIAVTMILFSLVVDKTGYKLPMYLAFALQAGSGILFYFALLVPFAIFVERLLINFADIRKKLAAVALIFAISYCVLWAVHPAFRLSNTPIIILIGFFMGAVGLFIIALLIQKFHTVMEYLRQNLDLIHRADVARASAAMAAFILGISNMRKRKMRTALTAVTIILLTFTILSFTSFETEPARLLRYTSSQKAPYDGVLIRNLAWTPMSEFIYYDLQNFFESLGLKIAVRSWFIGEEGEELRLVVDRVGGRGSAVASGLVGLSCSEVHFSPVDSPEYLQGEWFSEDMEDWPFVCLLPTRFLEALGIGVDDIGKATVSVLGTQVRVVGGLNSHRLLKHEDLDSEPLTPVDIVQQQFKEAGGPKEEQSPAFSATGDIGVDQFVAQKSAAEQEKSRYVHLHPDRVLFIPHELNLKLGGTIRSMAVSAGSEAEQALRPFGQVLREFAGRVQMALYAGVDGLINRLATRPGLSIGGVKGLLVPILIAALIVFNTMLGAVYERVTEIKVYASVGLAPMHIASLFLAESSVFAVIGAMLGYLLGQVVSFALMQVPWLMEGISLNYSSMSAVWSALLVVLVVIGSTAWPARMAGKLSVPDETRKMKIPPPTSDVWEMVFPFTVSSKESLGVMAFLREFFQSNDEDAVGAFTADNLKFYQQQGEGLTQLVLEADVWVAPLDMGISQHVTIAAVPDAEEPDISYLLFTIVRLSGEFQTWHRMNIGFLKVLRKQMLIWRLVTPHEKVRLTREGQEILAGAGVGAS